MAVVQIYTDGSCNNATHNSGGYGIVMISEDGVRHWCGGSYVNTTSARMEILAILRALEKCNAGDDIIVYSDNQYAVNTLAKGWIFKWQQQNFRARKNCDLWKKFMIEYNRLGGKVELRWVRGHAGDEYNEMADALAAMGAQRESRIKDTRYI